MNGLFVGLTTLDLIYLTDYFPHSNEKIVALNETITAGGPATNAAITFKYFGHQATLLSVIGNHPISQLICAELDEYSINVFDLDPYRTDPLPTSSIIVKKNSGERAVISINATKSQAKSNKLDLELVQDSDIILIDGHQMITSEIIAQEAKKFKIPIVVDGGSWKLGLEKVLPYVDYLICSENFYPPNCSNSQEVFSYLQQMGIPHIAITKGENPIEYWTEGISGKIDIPRIDPVDTLGAGDIFHGAFCHFILHHNFIDSLAKSSQVASVACQYFGTRQWMSIGSRINYRL
ncbi:PfkB domain protein [Rippkaea orientalis PCC 8801]|uniref:PfkB domain protein n=1 Tax=Rippkaea orientalis (strain PCC 8801 / RF-1) TaxID=41431 RepID=B7JZG9_RIPO1|nr:sugar kinase [Rippkaea orientalis]ACK64129.1 PfkB domain protein [Rippkaea orientalis PCC 8801]